MKAHLDASTWLSAGNTRLQQSGWMRYAPSMLRPAFRWIGALFAVALLAATVFVVNLIWFRPFSLNLFYEKAFITFVLENPELLTSIGIAEQFGYRTAQRSPRRCLGRQGRARLRALARISRRPEVLRPRGADAGAAALHARADLVHREPARRRTVPLPRLPGQPALRRAEPDARLPHQPAPHRRPARRRGLPRRDSARSAASSTRCSKGSRCASRRA